MVEPGDLWTLTTVTTMFKGSVAVPPPPPAPFPTTPYADDFESCPQFQEAAYFTDQVWSRFDNDLGDLVPSCFEICMRAQTGVWECQPGGAGHGMVMQQMAAMHPIAWRPDEQASV